MKKIFNCIAIFVLLAIGACNDEFMDRYPLDALSDVTFWTKPADLEIYANSFYPIFISDVVRGDGKVSLDNNSDNRVPGSKNMYIWNLEDVQPTYAGWSWSEIRRANYFLTRYQNVEGTASEILRYVGEVKFFRAWEYFKLVKTFGDVPWINKDLGTNDNDYLYKARDTRKLVMDSILADIDYAVEHLFTPDKTVQGRLHKDAALAFKARVCLYEGTFRKYHNLGDYAPLFDKAINAAQILISSGKYGLYSTGDPEYDYYQLSILEDKSTTMENIMCIKYVPVLLTNNISHVVSAQSNSGFSKDLIESYLCRDGKPIGVSSLYLGDDSLSMEISGRDPRLWQTLVTPKIPYQIGNTGGKIYIKLPRIIQNHVTGYEAGKDRSPYDKDYTQNNSIIGQFIFKYSEVLLNYAEAKAESGTINQSDIDNTINLLRDRVDVGHLNLTVGFTDPNWKDYGYALSPLLQEIRRERRVELVSEGFRWDDIVRWKAGKLLEVRKSILGMRIPPAFEAQFPEGYFNGIRMTPDRYVQPYPELTRTWNDRLYLHWIPTEQITLNPALIQNPGW